MTGDLRLDATEATLGVPAVGSLAPSSGPERPGADSREAVATGTTTGGTSGASGTATSATTDGVSLGEAGQAQPGVATQNGTEGAGRLRLRALIGHEFDVVVVTDASGCVAFVSASARRVLGIEPDEAVGKSVFDCLDVATMPAFRAVFDDLVARRRLTASLELQAQRSDGRLVVVEVVAANHLEDPIHGIVLSLRDVTEHRRREARADDVDRRHAAIVDSLVDGVMMVDAAGTIVRVNDALERLSGIPSSWLMGKRLPDVLAHIVRSGTKLVDADGRPVPDEDNPVVRSLEQGRTSAGVVMGVLRTGLPTLWVQINAQAMVDADGTVAGAVATFSDVTEQRRAAHERGDEQRFLEALLDTLEEGIVACDTEGRMTVFNPAAKRLHGLDARSDPIGKIPSGRGLLRVDGEPMQAHENPLVRALSGERVREAEMVMVTRAGVRRVVSVNGQRLVGERGNTLGAVVAIHDVTERKRNEARLAELALHDPLTGLANRTLLTQRLRSAIDRHAEGASRRRNATEAAGGTVAVFLLDLDDFKEINDHLGHDVGDEVLVAAARRLTGIVRSDDTVARLGGDEFVVVCEVAGGKAGLAAMSDRITTTLSAPYEVCGERVAAGASVGGVLLDEEIADPSVLLSRADDAMYAVKWSRRSRRQSNR
ncbi:MAG: PAS domain S-box protein [Acidimicrobiales bacterium]